MSFVDTQAGAANRAKAVVMVGSVHALIAAGLVGGLAVNVLVSEDETLTTVFIPETAPPPPPPEVIDQTEDVPSYVPPAAPKRKLEITRDPVVIVDPIGPTIRDDIVRYIPDPIVTPIAGPTSLPVAPKFTPAGPKPRNGPTGWISNNDYPTTPLRRGEEGTANYRLVVGSDGRVDDCEITASSSSDALDRTTCRLLERRARFDAATDGSGEKVVGTFSGTITWQIPE